MRAQRSGTIAMFGSLASWGGGPAFGLYAATKWACSSIAESLKPEVAPFGIDVTVIEPGYFRSGFLNPGARILSAERIQDYDDTAVGYVRKMLNETDNNQPGDVSKGSDVIVDVLTKRGVAAGREIPLRLVLGTDIQAAVRAKLESTANLLNDWQDISASTDYPKDV
jgi:NAD(P)-dependent dehydrogenase (short-subunit alcohol dehydrogenase family)